LIRPKNAASSHSGHSASMHARKRVIRLVNSERGTFVIGADNVPALPAEERKDTRARCRAPDMIELALSYSSDTAGRAGMRRMVASCCIMALPLAY
jgi:hypothetical protein